MIRVSSKHLAQLQDRIGQQAHQDEQRAGGYQPRDFTDAHGNDPPSVATSWTARPYRAVQAHSAPGHHPAHHSPSPNRAAVTPRQRSGAAVLAGDTVAVVVQRCRVARITAVQGRLAGCPDLGAVLVHHRCGGGRARCRRTRRRWARCRRAGCRSWARAGCRWAGVVRALGWASVVAGFVGAGAVGVGSRRGGFRRGGRRDGSAGRLGPESGPDHGGAGALGVGVGRVDGNQGWCAAVNGFPTGRDGRLPDRVVPEVRSTCGLNESCSEVPGWLPSRVTRTERRTIWRPVRPRPRRARPASEAGDAGGCVGDRNCGYVERGGTASRVTLHPQAERQPTHSIPPQNAPGTETSNATHPSPPKPPCQ